MPGQARAVEVTRWRRYGKDRLYVKDADGIEIGWWDLAASAGHPTTPETEVLLLEAVTAWQMSPTDAPAGKETSAPVTAE